MTNFLSLVVLERVSITQLWMIQPPIWLLDINAQKRDKTWFFFSLFKNHSWHNSAKNNPKFCSTSRAQIYLDFPLVITIDFHHRHLLLMLIKRKRFSAFPIFWWNFSTKRCWRQKLQICLIIIASFRSEKLKFAPPTIAPWDKKNAPKERWWLSEIEKNIGIKMAHAIQNQWKVSMSCTSCKRKTHHVCSNWIKSSVFSPVVLILSHIA